MRRKFNIQSRRFKQASILIIKSINYTIHFYVSNVEAGMVAIVFACIIFHFPSKPKHPPSITSAMERTAFLPSLINICTNSQVRVIYYCKAIANYRDLKTSKSASNNNHFHLTLLNFTGTSNDV